ncbi:MAG: c-type cytochrome [Verrucomicrobiales bacterium]|nr:c-type cytochrome [Verrucomicrobiales bacterium]
MTKANFSTALIPLFVSILCSIGITANGALEAGASAVNIDPPKLPVIQNGGFNQRIAKNIVQSLFARSLVLKNGDVRIAICVVDTCMVDRELCDKAKALIVQQTGIPADHILISATHTHTAPSAMRCLGCPADPEYPDFLIPKIAESVFRANAALQPAEAGWTVANAEKFTNTRRWIYLPHKMRTDPYGEKSIRAMMHPGHENPDTAGPAGPKDPDLTLLSIRTREGVPLAVLGNLSQHYYALGSLSSGYTGTFCKLLEEKFGGDFIGIMSQGTSGDLQWMDYSKPRSEGFPAGTESHYDAYCRALADLAIEALKGIKYRSDCPLAIDEQKLRLGRRLPDKDRIAWAEPIVEKIGDRLPNGRAEVLAKEVFWIKENPSEELKLQAVRIGDFGIATLPNEVYGITGLKLKMQSPLQPLMNIELANGAAGYIPPPEQHHLGGYTTWPARTAGLEVEAEPKIVETLLGSLEKVANQKPIVPPEKIAAHGEKINVPGLLAWWRMSAHSGNRISDASGNNSDGTLEPGYALFLPGPSAPELASTVRGNRSVHFAGGRMVCDKPSLNRETNYSVSMWFWNAMPNNARAVTGYFFSLGQDKNKRQCEHLGISGTATAPTGRLLFYNGDEDKTAITGVTDLTLQHWHHVLLVREGPEVRVYLDGDSEPEIKAAVPDTRPDNDTKLYIGGRADGMFSFEGKIDEVAVFDRPLKASENPVLAVSGYPVENKPLHPEEPPTSPEKALARIQVRKGFVAEQVASEPLTMDPVAIDWDTKGRLWVVEMADYPIGIDNNPEKPGGRVRVLSDTDHDGIYDKSELFLEGLNFPNGIMVWRDGVIITAAPEILFARDTDGDGMADDVKPIYTDLPEGNQQLRINGPRWGLDGWVYLANGWRSQGIVKSTEHGHSVEVCGRDLRIRPDTGEIEAVSGPTQFGRVRTDSGDWFGCMNSRPVYHYALEDRYLRRNPHTNYPLPYVEPYTGEMKVVYPAKTPEKRYHNFAQSGHFTSACGPGFYRDNLLFSDSAEHYFICEPFHNLVHHGILKPDRFTWSAERDDGGNQSEFFASDDRWCRPVMARTGPDGALWIVDMYRYVIEHPQFLPPHGKAELEAWYRTGHDRGRIYRVYPEGKRPPAWAATAEKNGAEPFKLLKSSNGIQRDLGHRILTQRRQSGDMETSEKIYHTGTTLDLTRLHILYLLRELGGLRSEVLKTASESRNPDLRRASIRLSENSDIATLIDDPDDRVQFQLALSLGEFDDPGSHRALAELFRRHGTKPYWRAALFSSVNSDNLPALLTGLQGEGIDLITELCALALLTGQKESSELALSIISGEADGFDETMRYRILGSLIPRLEEAKKPLLSSSSLSPAHKETIESMISRAPKIAIDSEAELDYRKAAIGLLSDGKDDIAMLASLLEEKHPPSIRNRAIEKLGSINHPEVASSLLQKWSEYSGPSRRRIISILLTRSAWAVRLLDSIESGGIAPSVLDASNRAQFDRVLPQAQKARLKMVLNIKEENSRAEVIAHYAPALKKGGNAEVGRQIFRRACVTCHRLENTGINLGPDLLTLTERSRKSLLDSILDPSSNVDPRYKLYTASTKDGRVLSGFLDSQSDTHIVIRQPDNQTVRISRADVRRLAPTLISLMPAGLEAAIDVDQMSDLLAYLEEIYRQ